MPKKQSKTDSAAKDKGCPGPEKDVSSSPEEPVSRMNTTPLSFSFKRNNKKISPLQTFEDEPSTSDSVPKSKKPLVDYSSPHSSPASKQKNGSKNTLDDFEKNPPDACKTLWDSDGSGEVVSTATLSQKPSKNPEEEKAPSRSRSASRKKLRKKTRKHQSSSSSKSSYSSSSYSSSSSSSSSGSRRHRKKKRKSRYRRRSSSSSYRRRKSYSSSSYSSSSRGSYSSDSYSRSSYSSRDSSYSRSSDDSRSSSSRYRSSNKFSHGPALISRSALRNANNGYQEPGNKRRRGKRRRGKRRKNLPKAPPPALATTTATSTKSENSSTIFAQNSIVRKVTDVAFNKVLGRKETDLAPKEVAPADDTCVSMDEEEEPQPTPAAKSVYIGPQVPPSMAEKLGLSDAAPVQREEQMDNFRSAEDDPYFKSLQEQARLHAAAQQNPGTSAAAQPDQTLLQQQTIASVLYQQQQQQQQQNLFALLAAHQPQVVSIQAILEAQQQQQAYAAFQRQQFAALAMMQQDHLRAMLLNKLLQQQQLAAAVTLQQQQQQQQIQHSNGNGEVQVKEEAVGGEEGLREEIKEDGEAVESEESRQLLLAQQLAMKRIAPQTLLRQNLIGSAIQQNMLLHQANLQRLSSVNHEVPITLAQPAQQNPLP